MQVLSADSLTGTRVENPHGEHLGSLKALMIDLESGRIAYAVLDFGGFLGMGNKLFAMPWRGFTINTAREIIILDVSKERLENAEGFDQNNWPDMSDPDFASRIYTHYGHEPYWDAPVR